MDSNPHKYIFVSHSSKDWDKVRVIRNYLEEKYFYPLLFHLKCLETKGEDLALLKNLLQREIQARRRFLYCNSKDAMKSEYVQWELSQVQTVKGAIFKEINLEKPSNVIEDELSIWTDYLKTIGFIGTWKSRIIRNRIIEKLRENDLNIDFVLFEDDEHIPIWNGQLPQGALDFINHQVSELDHASLIIGLKTSDYHVRGFCSRAEYYAVQRGGMRFLSVDIPDSECASPNGDFINTIFDSILANYYV